MAAPAHRTALASPHTDVPLPHSQQLTTNDSSLPADGAPLPAGDEKRTSMLDIVRDSLARSGKTTMLYRVVVCGKLSSTSSTTTTTAAAATSTTDRAEIGTHYQRFFKQYQAETELITGLLVVMENVWVHVLEASSKVTYAFLRDLNNNPSNITNTTATTSRHQTTHTSSPFTHVKVLLVQDDVPTRFFPFWAVRTNDDSAGGAPNETDMDENVKETTVTDVCVGMCTVGGKLAALNKSELKAALDELGSHFKDILPRPGTVERITESARVMGIEEWIDMFDKHSTSVLESELIWPAQQTLVF
ncbi:hypothetical protein DFJ77DRAFT_317323 [Powellomyces hirtus]|nr:hypothetical protein DFJ77DRAFT_317323 [Powellomyces hirtus]